MRTTYKQDKAVAGTSILISLVASLFTIGLLVMVFAIMGGKLYASTTDTTAKEVINETTYSIKGTTDFFDLFIVIGSMVVLILLVVVILVAIRNSGMMSGGTA